MSRIKRNLPDRRDVLGPGYHSLAQPSLARFKHEVSEDIVFVDGCAKWNNQQRLSPRVIVSAVDRDDDDRALSFFGD